MAPKSIKSKPKPEEHQNDTGGTMQFVGPAQQSFPSFLELTTFTVDTYMPNWNNPKNPSSYISPATYPFKNPDKSDSVIAMEKKMLDETKHQSSATQPELNSLERPIIDRRSDMGEFVVFQAIWKLVQENVQAPFLAVRGLDLLKKKDYLQQIFRHALHDIQSRFKNMMREYDFVLIGPKIGVIVIEVKSSNFTKGRDFAPNNGHIPDDIVKGITQLDSFDLEFIRECAGLQTAPVVPVRKILVTPNLKKSRLKHWYDNLVHVAKENVDKLINRLPGILEPSNSTPPILDHVILETHWFQDDMSTDPLKPGLYNSLRKMIKADGFQMPMDVYELYGPIIVGLGTALVIKSQQSVRIIKKHISTSAAILSDAAALDSQDPTGILKKQEPERQKFEENAKITLSSKMVLLTPEQRKALNGENHQFIIGAAGTGKTIVQQAKALEMLGKGKRVCVFATENFCQRYRKLFDDHGFKNYDVRPISFLLDHLLARSCCGEISSVMKDLETPVMKILDRLISIISGKNDADWVFNNVISISTFDAIFIDDAIDLTKDYSFSDASIPYALFGLMAVGKLHYGCKMLWIVLDPCPNPDLLLQITAGYGHRSIRNARFYGRILEQIMQLDSDYFSCSCLQQVMRCSESVFQSAYRLQGLGQMSLKPILGHKIHGFSESVFFRQFETSTVAQNEVLWKHIKHALDKLHQEGFEYGQMAVISDSHFSLHLPDYISRKCTECGIPNMTEDFSSEAANGKLAISTYGFVSSLEWPVVIFVLPADKPSYNESWRHLLLIEEYRRYRGCSRATTRILQIKVQYFSNNRSWEADIYKGMNGQYTTTKAKEDLRVSNMSETVDQLVSYTKGINGLVSPPKYRKRTIRRSFSVHNLDFSTVFVQSEQFKTERHNINKLINFAIESRLRSLLRSAEKGAYNKSPMDDEEIESTCQTTPLSSKRGNDYYGQLIFETSLSLPEETKKAFNEFWVNAMFKWKQDKIRVFGIWCMFNDLGDKIGELTSSVLSHCQSEEMRQKRSLIVQFCSLVREDKVLRDFC